MASPPHRYDEGLELNHYDGMEVHNIPQQVHQVHQNHDYHGMEVHQYPGDDADDTSEKPALHADAYVYDEDPRSRLHRDLKTRQIAMIALGGALGTGLLINT
jgi:yeast amino acid transporter